MAEADPTWVVADADVLAADLLCGEAAENPARTALDHVRRHSWMSLVASDPLLDDAQAVADKYGVTLETVAAFGKLTDVIRQYCTQHSITTVIVGTADRDAFSSYVVADDVTRIANTAPVPVVVV